MIYEEVRKTLNDKAKARAGRKFHEALDTHLDECAQCRNNPFDLCQIGAILLVIAVNSHGGRA